MSSKELIVCKNFKLLKKLGTGAFGEIYLAENRSNKDQKYAAKLQQTTTKFPQLYFEAKIYKYLTSSGSVTGIPKVHAMTTEGKYNVMLMDLLGKSLQDIFVQHQKRFSLKTVLMIGQQLIDRIQYLHQRQIIHRDIKPDNFLMGIGQKSHIVYVVDLGLSKKYIKDNKHIPYKQGKQLTGTARYASINTHMGIEQSRRDDIESIGYVLMYLLRGILPWQNMKAKDTRTKYKMILDKKMSTPADVLCKGFPGEMAQFINYAKGLKFQQKPDYNYLRNLLKTAMQKNKIQMDYIYDWTTDKKPVNIVKQPSVNTINQHPPTKQIKKASTTLLNNHNHVNSAINKQKTSQVPNVVEKQKRSSTRDNIGNSNKYSNSINKYNNGSHNKADLRKTTNSKYKNTTSNILTYNDLEALGSKITGPKISVIKR